MNEFDRLISLLEQYGIPHSIQNLHTGKQCRYHAPGIAVFGIFSSHTPGIAKLCVVRCGEDNSVNIAYLTAEEVAIMLEHLHYRSVRNG